MAAKVVYKVHVQRTDGRVDTLLPQGAPGWTDWKQADVAAAASALDKETVKAIVTEERVIREYNGSGKAKAKGSGTTLF